MVCQLGPCPDEHREPDQDSGDYCRKCGEMVWCLDCVCACFRCACPCHVAPRDPFSAELSAALGGDHAPA